MTDEKKKTTVIDLLELAHGYAILGHYMPFKLACVEEKPDDVVKLIAQNAITAECRARGIEDGVKPSQENYVAILGAAIERMKG